MTAWKKWSLVGAGLVIAAGGVGLFVLAPRIASRFEPMVREQALRYLRERFHSDVDVTALHIHLPSLSRLQLLLKHERVAKVGVDGEGLSMRFVAARDQPPLFTIRKFSFE